MTDDKRKLGDILANPQIATTTATKSMSADEAEQLLCALSCHFGIGPGDVLDDFRSNQPLAQLVRAMLNVAEDDRDAFQKAVDLVAELRARGWKGRSLYVEAERILNTPDAAGRRQRGITAGSIEQYVKEASALSKKHSLTSLFMPDGWKPPRRSSRPKGNSDPE